MGQSWEDDLPSIDVHTIPNEDVAAPDSEEVWLNRNGLAELAEHPLGLQHTSTFECDEVVVFINPIAVESQ
jgi:hypothetical protein